MKTRQAGRRIGKQLNCSSWLIVKDEQIKTTRQEKRKIAARGEDVGKGIESKRKEREKRLSGDWTLCAIEMASLFDGCEHGY